MFYLIELEKVIAVLVGSMGKSSNSKYGQEHISHHHRGWICDEHREEIHKRKERLITTQEHSEAPIREITHCRGYCVRICLSLKFGWDTGVLPPGK